MDYSHLIGSSFGQLTVERPLGVKDRLQCRCKCGNPKDARLSHLRAGSVKSCGCLLKTVPRAIFGKHFQSTTLTYKVWDSMVRRCTSTTCYAYPNYGGRGIDVCDRWMGEHGYTNFLADMGKKPDGLSIDRIDNGRGYAPGNCRWADTKTQARNRRGCVHLTHAGHTMTVAEWAESVGIQENTLRERLSRGWSTSRAITQPLRALLGSTPSGDTTPC